MPFSFYAAWSPTLAGAASAHKLNPRLYQLGCALDVAGRFEALNRPVWLTPAGLTRSLLGLRDWTPVVQVHTNVADADTATRILSSLMAHLGGRGQDWSYGCDPLVVLHGPGHRFDRQNRVGAEDIVAVRHASLMRLTDAPIAGPLPGIQQSVLRRLALHARDRHQPAPLQVLAA